MRGSSGGRVIKYLPDDFPFRMGQGIEAVYKAVVQLEKSKELAVPSNIRGVTQLGRTAVQGHLKELLGQGRLYVRYAKVAIGESTSIAGVYSTKKILN